MNSSSEIKLKPATEDSLWFQRQMVSFDVETTGVDLENDRIVTAAISVVGPGAETTNFSWVVDPGIPVPEEAANVHGYTTERVQAEGQAAETAIEEIIEILAFCLNQNMALVVYNARFDLTILDREARRLQLEPLVERATLRVIDPMVIDKRAAKYRQGGRKLIDLCRVYNVPFSEEEAHDACDDAMATARLAWRLGSMIPEMQIELDQLHDYQQVWARRHAESLQKYFNRIGRDANVEVEWPLINLP
jgi:DNA polymerase-3 subunit epsilon